MKIKKSKHSIYSCERTKKIKNTHFTSTNEDKNPKTFVRTPTNEQKKSKTFVRTPTNEQKKSKTFVRTHTTILFGFDKDIQQ